MIITWLVVAAINLALVFYLEKPTTRSETAICAAICFGWPVAVPVCLGYASVSKVLGKY